MFATKLVSKAAVIVSFLHFLSSDWLNRSRDGPWVNDRPITKYAYMIIQIFLKRSAK